MNQDRRAGREGGESEPHFSGLPTEGSHSEMAFGPFTRLDPLLVDFQVKECASERRRQATGTMTGADFWRGPVTSTRRIAVLDAS